MTEIIAGQEIKKVSETASRMTMLIWGDAGAGKTTLAATMPGRKLWFQFDPDGVASISNIENVDVVDFSSASVSVSQQFKNENNPLGIKNVIDKYDSFIFDSITNITDMTLMQGINSTTNATVERPSPAAFGVRNALAIRLIKNVMKATRSEGKHVCFVAHEGAPTTDKDGNLLHISLALGGQLPSNIGIDFSEMWAMYQVDNRRDRRIAISPSRKRKPMKTRMFSQMDEPEFDWKFNPDEFDDPSNEMYKVSTWFDMWKYREFKKLPLPGTKNFEIAFKEYKSRPLEK